VFFIECLLARKARATMRAGLLWRQPAGRVEREGTSRQWDLTFDMSGGPKGAKRPLERPLDGGVRFRAR
jgi:hypothetical protein